MVVTIEWIEANRTVRGAWTKAQLAAIGVDWPPKKGWKHRAVGRSVTAEQQKVFEAWRGPYREVRTKLPRFGELRERAILGGEPSL
jgi:hypothetical protein